MAVTPALTYPSKAIRMGTTPNLASLYLVRRRAVSPNMVVAVTRATIAAPNLMVRAVAAVLTDLSHGTTPSRMLYVTKKRRQIMVASPTVLQTFPIPYNPRGTTRPTDGPIWPRVETPTR